MITSQKEILTPKFLDGSNFAAEDMSVGNPK